jgi:glycosyltransferase involved in cell wall biosynthesis
VVLPYLRIYQSGVVLLAMSYGNPVLVSDIEGLLEAVSDGSTGFVFRSLDSAHLAERVGEIFATPGQRAEIAQEGLRTVASRNDWARLGEQFRASYQRALKVLN